MKLWISFHVLKFGGPVKPCFLGGPDVPSDAHLFGDNVVAAEVHQSDGTSSDFVFGAELFVVADPNAVPAHFVSVSPGDTAHNISTNASISVLIEDGAGSVRTEWTGPGTWNDLPGAPNPYTTSPASVRQ